MRLPVVGCSPRRTWRERGKLCTSWDALAVSGRQNYNSTPTSFIGGEVGRLSCPGYIAALTDGRGMLTQFRRPSWPISSYYNLPGPSLPQTMSRELWLSMSAKARPLRARRKAEVENRKEVGFLGTVLGIREHKKTRPASETVEAEPV